MTFIAINGFGRIGRLVLRRMIEKNAPLQVVAINASYPAKTLAHLLQYDSVHRSPTFSIDYTDDALIVNGERIQLIQEREPDQLPWKELKIDMVIEATGQFTDRSGASRHIQAGAKKVVITAPAKDEDVTLVMGVNHTLYDPEKHHIISNASCTTNALAPVVKVLHDAFGVQHGMMTTVHSVTNDQKVLDNPHKDLRRARTSSLSIIPTSTGAAKAIGKVIPDLNGRLTGMALRVPTPNVSMIDLVAYLSQDVTKEEVHRAFAQAAEEELSGILTLSDLPLVSSDYIGDSHSAVVDGELTKVMGRMVQVFAWYDNEWAYSDRVVDLVTYMVQANKPGGASALCAEGKDRALETV
ncbi:MAG: type I glyceraldehyde-3-phosphate dehydrogenase [Candidatus Carbobacillus altaicus]|nr:type I glyceraldehyde-3-phosphate dehydrogenase [Candidatus Carbobacillus altaicus]